MDSRIIGIIVTSAKTHDLFKIHVYITCDKECAIATRVPNPIRFYYVSNESLLNKLSLNIKYVLMYTRTHLT